MSKNSNRNNSSNRKRSPQERYKIRKWYAENGPKKKAGQSTVSNNGANNQNEQAAQNKFPNRFPFWARLKISKHRTTLVIDEDVVKDKQKGVLVDGFVHREATHTENSDYEQIKPNPDHIDPDPMYLKRPRKLPKRLFEPHNKALDMPKYLKQRYDKNNHKNADNDGEN